MSAETIRRAAALMRERAEAATPGRWSVFTDSSVKTWHPDDWMDVAYPDGRTSAEAGTNARHIASWHPAVTLAVADWLDAVDAEEWCCPECKYDPINENRLIEAAVIVARAYLGESA